MLHESINWRSNLPAYRSLAKKNSIAIDPNLFAVKHGVGEELEPLLALPKSVSLIVKKARIVFRGTLNEFVNQTCKEIVVAYRQIDCL